MTNSRDATTESLSRARAERVANQLGFDVSTDVLDEACDVATALVTETESAYAQAQTQDSDGERANDEENALLDVYSIPRQRTTTGPIADYQIAVKDNLAVRDLEMTCGSKAFSTVPSFDATVVERLLDAGSELVGKANMDAFAFGPSGEFSDHGRIDNPVASGHVVGGSSSGSGVAVAAGTVDLALGTDTGGSVRIPAACLGLVGAKPTYGLVPSDGLVHFAPSLDTTGPLTRDVETAATALGVIADQQKLASTPSQGGASLTAAVDVLNQDETLTIGLLEPFFDRSRSEVSSRVREASQQLPADAFSTKSVSVSKGWIEQAYLLAGSTEFAWYLRQSGVIRGDTAPPHEELRAAIASAKTTGLGAHVAERVLPAALSDTQTDGQAYAAARREAARFQGELEATFEDVDILVTPTIRTLPPERGRIKTTDEMMWLLGNTSPLNMTGHPAVTVPVGTAKGRPISVQVVAPQFHDARALHVAGAFEQQSGDTEESR
ncbi:amidase [Halomicrococcus sp. NG-SE-24]|uniref:amidase n=1 Tax=Halomicrococcus sp. NG-SE-24 TaxID=3436928 RepID=UPI003D982CE6